MHETGTAGGNGQVNLSVTVRPPSGTSALSGRAVLRAETTDNLPVTNVQFLLSGPGKSDAPIGVAHSTPSGWVVDWNTALVANGAYTVAAVAYDDDGRATQSAPVSVTVRNR